MKYLEFAFHTTPCTEVVNDVLSAVLGEVGFESFVEQADGIAAYIQKDLYSENALKEALAYFPLPDTQVEYTYQEAVNCWTTICKANPCLTWDAEHLFSPYWHVCAAPYPVQLST